MEIPQDKFRDWHRTIHNHTVLVSSDSNISGSSGPISGPTLQDTIADTASNANEGSHNRDTGLDNLNNNASLASVIEADREDTIVAIIPRNSHDKLPTSGSKDVSPDPNKEQLGQASAEDSSVIQERNEPNIRIWQDRVAALEKKIYELESRGVKQDKGKEEEENIENGEGRQEWQEEKLEWGRTAAIPVLHRVRWTEFKNKHLEDRRVHAVDVLIGNAKFYYERGPEEKGRKKWRDNGHDLRENKELTSDVICNATSTKEMPERIRINSLPILAILSEILSEDPSSQPKVFLRPYKLFVRYEDEIKQKLKELEIGWGNEEAEAGAANHVNAPNQGKTASNLIPPILSAARTEDTTATADTESEIEDVSSDERSLNKLEVEAKTEELTSSVEALRDMRCLVEFIDVELKPTIDSFNTHTNRKVFFRDLWFLFKPGVDVLAPLKKNANNGTSNTTDRNQDGGPEQSAQHSDSGRSQTVFRVLATSQGRPILSPGDDYTNHRPSERKVNMFWVRCYSIDFDGKRFGPHIKDFVIYPYDGEKDITSLDVYPMRYSPQGEEMREYLKMRGAKFGKLTAVKHQFYLGPTLIHHPNGAQIIGAPQPRQLDQAEGRVIIDFQKALSRAPSWIMPFDTCSAEFKADPREINEDFPTSLWQDRNQRELNYSSNDFIYDDSVIDRALTDSFILEDPFIKHFAKNRIDDYKHDSELSHNELVLLPNRAFAYLFRNREFVLLSIDHLREVRPNIHGWNDLKLPNGHKSMLQALVQTHFREKTLETMLHEDRHDIDVVQGKGRGLIILLHGAPGVGKTSTAECVAESNGKPLFPITCGDLGITAENVENSLAEKFDLAQRWDCILLLDEADVFLAARTKTDLVRNTLVSVFLRVLEYYTGILFLTTNRVGAFDEAFKSRIHISLYYPPLKEAQTLSIWKMNLKRILAKKQGAMIVKNEDELLEYAKNHFQDNVARRTRWNGRQIRNAFQTAAALAEFEAYERNTKHRKEHTCTDCPPVIPKLEVGHFDVVAGAALEFDLYIADTIGHDEAEQAYMRAERSDSFRRRDAGVTARKLRTENYRGPDSARWSVPRDYTSLPRYPGKSPGTPTTSPSQAGLYSVDHYDPSDPARGQPGRRDMNARWQSPSFQSPASKSSSSVAKQIPNREQNYQWDSEPWPHSASRAMETRPYLPHVEIEPPDEEFQED